MTNTNVSSRFDGHHTTGEEGTQPMQSGVLPEDFGQRLERLKEASGLSWRGMAKALGVDPKQLLRWRKPSAWTPSSCSGGARASSRAGERCTRSSASQAGCPAAWRSSSARASR